MGLDEYMVGMRTHGRIDEHDGEYVETEFTCVPGLRIPLLPARSFWIVDDQGSQRTGFPIELHPRSVAATYLRIWAPGIATAVLVLWSSPLAAVIAAALFGLSAWSWTWWPRDAAVRRRSDFDLAAFGSRCDPVRMTDAMHQRLADDLTLRAGADPRPPDDVVRFGARTVDEALCAYGLLRLTAARRLHPRGSPDRAHGAERMVGPLVRRLRRRGGPYRDRSAASALELWVTLSAAAQASAGDRRARPLRSYDAVPAPAVVLPSLLGKPWIWLVVLAASTIVSAVALRSYWTPPPPQQPALARPPASQLPSVAPRPCSGDDLANRPMGEYISVRCDFVQNSDQGNLYLVTFCGVGPRTLAVAGGNRRHDSGHLLQGYIDAIPTGERPSWASALRKQMSGKAHFYDFYLRRVSYGDDTPDDTHEEGDRRNGPRFAPHPEQHHPGDDTQEALIRAMAMATLAGWFVWLRLWQLRRRVATWIVTG